MAHFCSNMNAQSKVQKDKGESGVEELDQPGQNQVKGPTTQIINV